MTDTKPQLANTLPKEEDWNGLITIEKQLVDPLHAGDVRLAVVKFTTGKIVRKVADGDVYPILTISHFEPLTSQAAQDAAQELLTESWHERTGKDEIPDNPHDPQTPLDMPSADADLGEDGV